jgi:hypothetical protein
MMEHSSKGSAGGFGSAGATEEFFGGRGSSTPEQEIPEDRNDVEKYPLDEQWKVKISEYLLRQGATKLCILAQDIPR